MFKGLSTVVLAAFGTLFAIYLSSWCFHIMNIASNFAVLVGISGLLCIWLLVMPFFYKRIYIRLHNLFKENI